MAREKFYIGKKISLHWRGPRRVARAISNWVNLAEDLRNGQLSEVHATRLKFNSDSSLDTINILPHVLSSETGMKEQRLLKLIDKNDDIKVFVCWRGLAHADYTEKTFQSM